MAAKLPEVRPIATLEDLSEAVVEPPKPQITYYPCRFTQGRQDASQKRSCQPFFLCAHIHKTCISLKTES